MNLTLEIAGWDALPVWTVPYITAKYIPPDLLIDMLAKPTCDEGRYCNFPSAFNVDEDGNPHLLPPSQWFELAGQLDKLNLESGEKGQRSSQEQNEWWRRSFELIMPYRAYIWLNEFRQWFDAHIQAKYFVFKDDIPKLCLNPLMPNDHEEYFKKTILNWPKSPSQNEENKFEDDSHLLRDKFNIGEKAINTNVPTDRKEDFNRNNQNEDQSLCGGKINGWFKSLESYIKNAPDEITAELIAELWAAVRGKEYRDRPFHEIKNDYLKLIEQSVIAGELKAIVEIRKPGFDDGFEQITDWNRIRKINNRILNGETVQFTIARKDVAYWLEKIHQWPLEVNCLLSNWWDFKSSPTEAVNYLEILDATRCFIYNGKELDWGYWASREFSSFQAVRLANHIDPIEWPGSEYKQGKIPDDFLKEMKRVEEWLNNKSQNWTLRTLILALQEYSAKVDKPIYPPLGMLEASNQQINSNTIQVVSNTEIKPKKQPSNRKQKDSLPSKLIDSQGKPEERQEFFRLIWEKLNNPTRNQPVWVELRELAKNDNHSIKKVVGNNELTFSYLDGTVQPLTKKTFQNDMSEVRNIPTVKK